SAVLAQLLAEREASTTTASTTSSTTAFRIGPGVLRAPPPRRSSPAAPAAVDDDNDTRGDVDDILGELTDMLLVGADEGRSGRPEVHLQFKSDVFGGLHLRLVKQPEGFSAIFVVDDASTRRAVAPHVEALVQRLRDKGFSVVEARLDVG
ncbi:MAG TPA: hypothetical protein VGF99_16190, partial [Myxococcota bacterium]